MQNSLLRRCATIPSRLNYQLARMNGEKSQAQEGSNVVMKGLWLDAGHEEQSKTDRQMTCVMVTRPDDDRQGKRAEGK
jgi:hypothetical protein